MEQIQIPAQHPGTGKLLPTMALILVFLSSCISSPGVYQPPRENLHPRDIGAFESSRVIEPGQRVPADTLTLQDALSLAMSHNPELSVSSWRVDASKARTLQAGLRPNPQIEGEVENFAGSSTLGGFDEAETTIALSQLFELGDKRRKRLRVAELGQGLAEWDLQAKRLQVISQTSLAFIEVLAAQQRVKLQSASLDLAREVLNSVSERENAGKSSPIETIRAQIVVSQGEIALGRARRSLDASRAMLAANWGSDSARFTSAIGSLDETPDLPSLDSLKARISNNPDVSRWNVEIAQRSARIELVTAEATPDATFTGGARLLQGTQETAFVVGLSIPLPIHDRNQGRIREAEIDLSRATDERRAAEIRVHSALTDGYQSLLSSFQEVTALREKVLPAAAAAYDGIRESYRQGKLTQLDVLDSQKTLFEVRDQYARSLTDYHRARALVEGLVGTPISELKKGGLR